MRVYGPSKQWAEIISCYPTKRQVHGKLRDGGKVQIGVFDVPEAFRWPQTGEIWSICRDAMDNVTWVLDGRVNGYRALEINGSLHLVQTEDLEIENMAAGDMRLDSDKIYESRGYRVVAADLSTISPGETLIWDEDESVFVPGDASSGGGGSAVVWRGDWSGSNAYAVDDLVFYNGSTYRAKVPVASGQPAPTNGATWGLVAQKGDLGPTGPQGSTGLTGNTGPTGPPNSLSIGTVDNGGSAGASITGAAPSQTLNLTLPQGPTGPVGPTGYDTAPIGTVVTFTGSTVPDSWALANGQTLPEATYPDLATFAAANAGNGLWGITGTTPTRTITLPDLRDKFLYGSGARTVGTKSQTNPALANPGEESHTLLTTEAAQKAVTSTNDYPDHSHGLGIGWTGPLSWTVTAGGAAYYILAGGNSTLGRNGVHYHDIAGSSATNGHNNMPPYVVLAYIVKVQGVSIDNGTLIGPTGPAGPTGPGVPTGGSTGQALVKVDAADYNTTWGAAGHTILDEGVARANRPNMDFQGAGVSVTDDAANTKTIVTIPGGGGGGGSALGGAQYTTTIGDGTARTFTLTHALGTRNVQVSVYQTASPYQDVTGGLEFEHASVDQVIIRTSTGLAPLALGEYTVVVSGPGAALTSQTMDAWHQIGAAGEPAFVNSWVNATSVVIPAAFRKDPLGKVQMRGMVRAGASQTIICTLPVGYRPPYDYRATAVTYDGVSVVTAGTVMIKADGTVWYQGWGGQAVTHVSAYLDLDQIEFDTDSVTTLPAGPPGTSGNSWSAVIGDGTSKTFTLTHGMGTRSVNVACYQTNSPYSEVEIEVERTSPNVVTVKTGTALAAPTAGQYTVVITGPGAAVSSQTIEGWHTVGGSGEPAFQNGWSNYGSGYSVAAFRKDPLGRVQIRGLVKTGAASSVVFTLPVGYRPVTADIFAAPSSNGTTSVHSTVEVRNDGTVWTAYGGTTWVDLAVSFDTDTVTTLPAGPPGGQSYTQTFGDGTNRVFTVPHNLGTWNVNVSVRETNAPRAEVPTEIEYTDQNTLTIRTSAALAAPTAGQYTIVVNGPGSTLTQQTLDPFHLVGTTGEPAFQNGWTNYSTGYNRTRFWKDPMGMVHVEGMVTGGTLNNTAFTLPVGYRPSMVIEFNAQNGPTAERMGVDAGGNVIPYDFAVNIHAFSLHFRAEDIPVTTLPAGPQGIPGGTSISSVIGDGASRTFTVDHNMATRNVNVQVFETQAPYSDVTSSVEFERNSLNQITMRANPALPAPSQNQYTVVVSASGVVNSTSTPLDTWHIIGDATTGLGSTFGPNVFQFGGAESVPAFRKDPFGKVQIRGLIYKNAAWATSDLMFTLPAGYRMPSAANNSRFPVSFYSTSTSYKASHLYFNPNGDVRLWDVANATTGANAYLDLSSVEFDTDTVTSYLTGPQGPPGPAGNLPAKVSALPTTGLSDGLEVYFQNAAMATDGVIWHLRYNPISSSPYKWEAVGGGSLVSEIGTGEAVTNGGWGNAATVGPDVTVPLAGDYDYEFEMQAINGVATFVDIYPALSIAGATPVVGDYNIVSMPATTNYKVVVRRARRKLALSAGTLLRVQYGSNPAQSISYSQRRLEVRPVRVG